MRAKKEKRKSRLLGLALVLVLTYGAFLGVKGFSAKSQKEAQVQKNQETIEAMEAEIADMEKELENADSVEYAEEVARDEMGMVKPGEIIFVDKNKQSQDD